MIYSGLLVFFVFVIIKIDHSIVSGVQRLGIIYFTGWIDYVVLRGGDVFSFLFKELLNDKTRSMPGVASTFLL